MLILRHWCWANTSPEPSLVRSSMTTLCLLSLWIFLFMNITVEAKSPGANMLARRSVQNLVTKHLERRGGYLFPWTPNPDILEFHPPLVGTQEEKEKLHRKNQEEIRRLTKKWRNGAIRYARGYRNLHYLEHVLKDPHHLTPSHRFTFHLQDARLQRSALRKNMDSTVRLLNRLGPTTVNDQKRLHFTNVKQR